MPADPLTEFRRSLENLDATRRRMEILYAGNTIGLRDIHSVYEALFLRGVTGFETFLERQFFGILKGKIKYPKSRVSLRMAPSSHQAASDIVLQNDDYLKWIPFKYTESRAKLYLNGGRPFSELTDGDRSIVKTITIIRNAIAHTGPHAITNFKEKVIGASVLLPVEKRPAGFLRSQVTPAQRRFEVYMNRLAKIAVDIS